MNFTDKSFFFFIVLVYGLWLVFRKDRRVSAVLLLAASLVFYGLHRWELLFLILSYCVVDWSCGLWIARSSRPKLALTVGIAYNLVLLGYWKYTPLIVRTLMNAALALDLPLSIEMPRDWILPWGISFYAFTGIGYMVDVYRKEFAPERSAFRFTLFLTFFPHLVAGPILRARDFLADLQPERFPQHPKALLEATLLLGRGFFKKMVLADRIAEAIDPFFAHVTDSTTAGVWSLPYVWLYAIQIYLDFSAYTDIARGLGLMFGFRWPENFNLPYLAGSITEFWQRWHMTLSQFLRDYLYIPLGGNRKGAWRTCINLMITMLLGGLWHGASWAFLFWGGLHGTFLIAHKLWSTTRLRVWLVGSGSRQPSEHAKSRKSGDFRYTLLAATYRVVATVVTFHLVCLAWCFFRLTELPASLACVKAWVVFERQKMFVGDAADMALWAALAGYVLFAVVAHKLLRKLRTESRAERFAAKPVRSGFAWGFGAALLLLAVLLSPGGEKASFIYFQF